MLWFDPTVKQTYGELKVTDLRTEAQDPVRAGKQEPSIGAARAYVRNQTTTTTTTAITTSTTATSIP